MNSNNSTIPLEDSIENSPAQESRSKKPFLIQKRRAPVKLDELDTQDRKILIQEFENAVAYFAEANFPVYLDGFGIIFPKTFTRNRITTMRDKYLLHAEKLLTLEFEKCNELVALHRERFVGIIEIKDLSYRVYEKAIPFLTKTLTPLEVRKYVRAIIDSITKQVIENGRHNSLKTLGEFYALHNRQGNTFADWYAGSDILIKTKFLKILNTTTSRFLDRPVFLSSTEPFSAVYGNPVLTESVNLKKELKALGWDVTENESLQPFSYSVFSSPIFDRPGHVMLTFVSDGLRKIAGLKDRGAPCGNEFVIQCIIEEKEEIPHWPARLMTGAWVLLHSAKDGKVNVGSGLPLGASRIFDNDSASLSTLFTTSFQKFGGEQLCEDGPFEYLSLIAISSDEAQVASVHGVELLLTILEHKNLHELTKPSRSSIVSKTSLIEAH